MFLFQNIAGYRGELPVAVKTLTSLEDEDIKKFLEEIDLMKKFANPNIVSLLGSMTFIHSSFHSSISPSVCIFILSTCFKLISIRSLTTFIVSKQLSCLIRC